MLKLEVYIQTILLPPDWYEIDYFTTGLRIIRQRNKQFDLVVQTSCEGDFKFACSSFDLLLPFINTVIELPARLTEKVCEEEYIHVGILKLNNQADFQKKILTGTFEIKDRYWNWQNHPQWNGDTKINLKDYPALKMDKLIYSSFFYDSQEQKNASAYGYSFEKVLNFFAVNIFGATYTEISNIKYVLLQSESFKTGREFDFHEEPNFEITFNDIMTWMRDYRNYSWWINDSNELKLDARKFRLLLVGTDNFTSFENFYSKIVLFKQDKFSEIRTAETDYSEGINKDFEKYFASSVLKFENLKTNINEITSEISTNIESENKKLFLYCRALSSALSYNNLNIDFINVDASYLLGDWSSVDFILNGKEKKFTTAFLWFEEGDIARFDAISGLTFNFAWGGAGGAAYTTGDLRLYCATSGENGNGTGFGVLNWNVALGNNNVFPIPYFKKGWHKLIFETTTLVGVGDGIYNAKISNFSLSVPASRYLRLDFHVVGGESVPNYFLSNYFLKSLLANMPLANANLQMADINENRIGLHRQADIFQNMKIKDLRLLKDFDFEKRVITSFGNMIIDKAEREWKANNVGIINLELSNAYI